MFNSVVLVKYSNETFYILTTLQNFNHPIWLNAPAPSPIHWLKKNRTLWVLLYTCYQVLISSRVFNFTKSSQAIDIFALFGSELIYRISEPIFFACLISSEQDFQDQFSMLFNNMNSGTLHIGIKIGSPYCLRGLQVPRAVQISFQLYWIGATMQNIRYNLKPSFWFGSLVEILCFHMPSSCCAHSPNSGRFLNLTRYLFRFNWSVGQAFSESLCTQKHVTHLSSSDALTKHLLPISHRKMVRQDLRL